MTLKVQGRKYQCLVTPISGRSLLTSFSRHLPLLVALFVTAACNSDVFIDDFLPKVPSPITLKSKPVSVNFEAANWDVLFITEDYSNINYSVSAPDGHQLSLPLENSQLAVVDINNGYLDFMIERLEKKKLDIIPGENMYDSTKTVLITVGNYYEYKDITVNIPPSPKYHTDSIIYHWGKGFSSENALKLKDSFIVNNTKSLEPVSLYCYPYKGAFTEITCHPDALYDEAIFTHFFGKGQPAKIRDIDYIFGPKFQKLPVALDPNMEVKVTINAGEKRRVEVFLDVDQFSVPFTAYASNPESGRKRTFTGSIYCEKPYGHVILKRLPDDE